MISLRRYCAHYLLTLSTFSYATGILIDSTPIFVEVTLLPAMFACLAGIGIGLVWGSRNLALPLVLLFFMIFGMVRSTVNHGTIVDGSHLVVSIEDQQELVLVGTLAEMVAKSQDKSRAVIDMKFVRTETSRQFTETAGKILLLVEGEWPRSVNPGHAIIVRTKVQVPRTAAVPGSFDYRKYLARKNIFLTGHVKSPILVQPVENLDTDWKRAIYYRIETLRELISRYMESALSERNASLYKALIIGDRSSLAPEVAETLKRSGIMHLWAISGMHLGLLTVLSYSIIYWLLRRSERLILSCNLKKAALLLTLPLLLLYALLSGFQPPAARAFIMTSCMVFALCGDRFHSAVATLSGAAFLILLIDPMAIESPSFQLSFAAVAAIILGAPPLSALIDLLADKFRGPGRTALYFVLSVLGITILAMIGTLPLLLFHFNRLSLVTLPANLLIQPLICFFSLPLGMLSLPFIFLAQPVATILLKLGACGLDLSHIIAATLTIPDSTQLWAPTPSPPLIPAYYLFLFALAVRSLSPTTYLVNLIALAGVLLIMIFPIHPPFRFNPPVTRVTVLSVGHGSANIIELSAGRVVLIDGGAQSGPGYDCGARLIGPYLWHEGIGRIDDIFITHDDNDHYNGIFTLIKRFKPERLWLPHLNEHKHGYSSLVDLARREGIDVIIPEPGVAVAEDGDEISVLGGYLPIGINNEDDSGLVLKLDAGDVSVLFPGDITIRRELELVNSGEDLHSTILLSPHHGSSTSNSAELLSTVSPELLIVSSGISRISDFPAKETLDTARNLGIPVLNTATDGTIAITIAGDGEGYRVARSTAQRRYWREG